MATGSPIAIGFFPASQSPVDERYLNDGVPWADQQEVLDGIPLISRHPYLTVNIDGVEYWFSEDMTTLNLKTLLTPQDASDIPITDTGDLFTATDVETALAEVMTLAKSVETDVTNIQTVSQTVFTVHLPANATVAGRCSNASQGTDYPQSWTIGAYSQNANDMQIAHGLGKHIADVTVWSVNTGVERKLISSAAYTGLWSPDDDTLIIEGLSTVGTAIVIHIIIAQ